MVAVCQQQTPLQQLRVPGNGMVDILPSSTKTTAIYYISIIMISNHFDTSNKLMCSIFKNVLKTLLATRLVAYLNLISKQKGVLIGTNLLDNQREGEDIHTFIIIVILEKFRCHITTFRTSNNINISLQWWPCWLKLEQELSCLSLSPGLGLFKLFGNWATGCQFPSSQQQIK